MFGGEKLEAETMKDYWRSSEPPQTFLIFPKRGRLFSTRTFSESFERKNIFRRITRKENTFAAFPLSPLLCQIIFVIVAVSFGKNLEPIVWIWIYDEGQAEVTSYPRLKQR